MAVYNLRNGFFSRQQTAYEIYRCDWTSDVCSSDLGLGPSHAAVIRDVYGLSYDHPGRNTEEYLTIITAALRGEPVDFAGTDWSAHTGGRTATATHPVQVLLAALSPRMLRIAGALADG